VVAHDLTRGVPFPEASFDVVYHSHVLEHFHRDAAERFLRECRRVLRPGGVLRVAVPDLEQMARLYLATMERCLAGERGADDEYEWMMLELYDQTVREHPGGQMGPYLMQENVPAEEFVLRVSGTHAKGIIESARTRVSERRPGQSLLMWRLSKWRRYPYFLRESLLRLLLRRDYDALRVGRFRRGGEVHLWMYDRYSLCRLLQRCGFERVARRGAKESYVSDWARYNLDTEADGTVYKPESLFMEGVRPGQGDR
jgi:SAM-dependent methyltransferase